MASATARCLSRAPEFELNLRTSDQSGARGRSGQLALTVPSQRLRLILTTFGPALVITVASLTLFPVPAGVAVQGLILGLLGAMVAVGMALIPRPNRILHFAHRAILTAP